MNQQDIELEIARLSGRIAELQSLQKGQKHLPFITSHLQEHIDQLQQRLDTLRSERIA